jgi:uncharacterized protein YbjQ (UPF0145 family)
MGMTTTKTQSSTTTFGGRTTITSEEIAKAHNSIIRTMAATSKALGCAEIVTGDAGWTIDVSKPGEIKLVSYYTVGENKGQEPYFPKAV